MMLEDSSDDECGFYVTEKQYAVTRALALDHNNNRESNNSLPPSFVDEADNSITVNLPSKELDEDFEISYESSEDEQSVKRDVLDEIMDLQHKRLLSYEICSFIHELNKNFSEFGTNLLTMRLTMKNDKSTVDSTLRSKLLQCRKRIELCRKAGELLCKLIVNTNYQDDEKRIETEIKMFENLPCTSFLIDDIFINPVTGLSWNFIGVFQKFDNVTKTFLNQFLKYVDIIRIHKERGELDTICLHNRENQVANLTRSSVLLSEVANRLTVELEKHESAMRLKIVSIFIGVFQYLCNFFRKFPLSTYFF